MKTLTLAILLATTVAAGYGEPGSKVYYGQVKNAQKPASLTGRDESVDFSVGATDSATSTKWCSRSPSCPSRLRSCATGCAGWGANQDRDRPDCQLQKLCYVAGLLPLHCGTGR